MKKLRIKETQDGLVCLCGNTTEDEGWEEDTAQRFLGIYLAVCKRCGIKFDDETLEIVGMRLVSGYRNDLVEHYFERIAKQSSAYFKKKNKGVLFP